MTLYVVRRLLAMVPTLFLVSIACFIIIQLPPGDFVTSLAAQMAVSGAGADQATMDNLRHQYGLDQPKYVQYIKWVSGFARGDFGYSFEWKRPVRELIGDRLGLTLLLSALSLVLMWLVALPVGIYSATHRYSGMDHALTALAFLGLSVPDFLLGLIYLAIGIFVFQASATGLVSPKLADAPWSAGKVADVANHLLWPAIILGLGGMTQLIRILRGSMLEVTHQQFITTARAKGLNERVVVHKHALKLAINPLVSVMGLQLPQLVSGATILGIVLSMPTTGPMFVRALISQDMYLAGTFLLFLALMLMLGNLLADVALAWIDPRIRYQ